MVVPPVYPSTPAVPDSNTALGTLNDAGLTSVSSVGLLGDFFNPDIADQRFEYVGETIYSSNHNTDDVLYAHEGTSLYYDLLSAYTPMRMLKLLSGWYADLKITYLFYGVKPALTTGKLLLTYTPDPNYSNSNTGVPLLATTKIWDVASSNTCEFTIDPWSPINQNRKA